MTQYSHTCFSLSEPESGDWEQQAGAVADRCMFVQELFLSSLTEGLRLDDDDDDDEETDDVEASTEPTGVTGVQQPTIAPLTPPPPAPPVVVRESSRNCNNSSTPPATNNTKQRNKVREPPPPPSTAPLSSSPSSKLVKQ